MIFRTILFTLVVFISGCATYYENPKGSDSAELIGTFKTKAEFKEFLNDQGYGPKFSKFIVMPGSVDDVVVGLNPVPTYIVPGKKKLGIRVYDKAERAEFVFMVNVEENEKYQAKFIVESLDGVNIIEAWLENALNGERITEVQKRRAIKIEYPNAPLIL